MIAQTKQRCDSWAASLSQEEQWKIYSLMRRHAWQRVCEYIRDEHNIEPPSRSRLYAWRKHMAKAESGHRIEQAIIARDQVDDLAARAKMTDTHLIDSYKTLAAELAINGDAATARTYTEMALSLAAQQTKARELELKAQAQEIKEDALKLQREKFEAAEARLNATLDAAKNLNKSGGLSDEGLAEIERAISLI